MPRGNNARNGTEANRLLSQREQRDGLAASVSPAALPEMTGKRINYLRPISGTGEMVVAKPLRLPIRVSTGFRRLNGQRQLLQTNDRATAKVSRLKACRRHTFSWAELFIVLAMAIVFAARGTWHQRDLELTRLGGGSLRAKDDRHAFKVFAPWPIAGSRQSFLRIENGDSSSASVSSWSHLQRTTRTTLLIQILEC